MIRKFGIVLCASSLFACRGPDVRPDATDEKPTRRSPIDVPGCFMCRWPVTGSAAHDAEWLREVRTRVPPSPAQDG